MDKEGKPPNDEDERFLRRVVRAFRPIRDDDGVLLRWEPVTMNCPVCYTMMVSSPPRVGGDHDPIEECPKCGHHEGCSACSKKKEGDVK